MSPLLLFPAGLLALTALALPLLLHLARREENRPLDFAALRWLDQRPRPRSRIRFDERLLLALRLLLLALLALWLARPALTGDTAARSEVLVVPGANLVGAPADARWLATGFPGIDTPAPAGRQPLASLLRQADAELPAGGRLIILVPNEITGADAERPRLTHAVDWRIVGGRVVPSEPARPVVLGLAVRAATGQPTTILRAVARAWQASGPIDFGRPADPLPPADQVLAWAAPGPLPQRIRDWIERGGTAILSDTASAAAGTPVPVWRDERDSPLLEMTRIGRGRAFRFTRPLTLAAIPQAADPTFPARLAALLTPAPAPSRVFARDYAPERSDLQYPQPARPLGPIFGTIIAALFVAERWLATRRSRSATP